MASNNQEGIFFFNAQVAGMKAFPKDCKRDFISRIDPRFTIIFLSLLVSICGAFWVLSHQPVKETASDQQILKIQERYAQLVLNQPKKEVAKPVEKIETPVKTTETAQDEGKKIKVDRANESVGAKEQRKAATSEDRRKVREGITRKVQSSGIFAAITANRGGSGAGSTSNVSDLLGGAASGLGDIGDIGGASIGKGTFATKNVTPEMLKTRRGEATSGVGIATENVGSVSGTQIASVAKVNLTSAPPEIKGDAEAAGSDFRSMSAINKVVSAEESRLRKVYESMLKRDPGLSGKLVIKFNIQPDGSVSDVTITKTTTNNPSFDERIVSYIKRFKFPAIREGGIVEVTYPFVFTSAS
jgi:TonB family protein